MVVGYSLLLLLLLVALITLAVLGYWLMYVAARWQLQCHVCHPPIPPRAVDDSRILAHDGSSEGTQRASDGKARQQKVILKPGNDFSVNG